MTFLDRLPGPLFVWYLTLALAVFSVFTLARVLTGTAAFGGNLGFRLFSALGSAVPAYLAHLLNRTAVQTFDQFAPALRQPTEADRLKYHLTTAPALPSLLFSLAGAAVGAGSLQAAPEMVPLLTDVFGSVGLTMLFGAGSWFINSHFAYRLSYQLVWVSRLYTRHAMVDLTDWKPIFAFSRLAARAASYSIVVVTGYAIGWAQAHDLALAAAIVAPNLSLAVAAFIWPLLGAHRLLQSARDDRRRVVASQVERASEALHKAVVGGHFGQVPPIKDALTALDLERSRLDRLPTWPWAPGTVRGVAATVFLPVVIWLIQFGLGRWLG